MQIVGAQTVTTLSDNINHLILQRNLINLALQALPKMIWAIVILLFTRWVAEIIRPIGFRVLKYAEPTLQKFLIQVGSILVWMAGSVAALNEIGLQTTTIVTVIGAAGLAIGLALQNSLSHFAGRDARELSTV